MKSSNKFVADVVAFVDVVVIDDGYIHASPAVADVAVVEVDTTFIYICPLFFSFPKFQISRIESIYWATLTACLEEQKNEKNEERVYMTNMYMTMVINCFSRSPLLLLLLLLLQLYR
jgi:hypothetical protein